MCVGRGPRARSIAYHRMPPPGDKRQKTVLCRVAKPPQRSWSNPGLLAGTVTHGVADRESVGPGTPRLTVAGAAVYVADKLTEGKTVTQQEVVDAVEQTFPSSK